VPRQFLRPFILVTGLFFLWAIPHNLNDILIRQFMKSFEITRLQAGLVQSAFYVGYFVIAMPAALLMKKFSYKAGILTGLLLFATGDFLFYPAAIAGRYGYFLCALFVIASGLAFLETAANPFIAQLGSQADFERRLNFSQAFNPLGSITGVVIGTLFIFSGIELTSGQVFAMQAAGTYAGYLQRETLRVVTPYLVLGCIALLFALVIGMTKFPVIAREQEQETGKRPHHTGKRLGCAIFAQFMYVGAQVGTWSYFITYVQDYVHLQEKSAGELLSVTLAAFLVGRFSTSYLMKFIAPIRLMIWYSLANVVLVSCGIALHNWMGVIAILLTSFFMAPMFPTIFAMGIKDLGPATKIGGSLLVMAVIGGAVWTPVMGWIATRTHSIAEAYQVPLYGYVCVALMVLLISRMEARSLRETC
jgi:FHS family L-fucose permease-like MFS transporter